MEKLLRYYKVPVLIIFLLFCFYRQASAQVQSCSYTLKEAQRLYQQGLIKDIPAMLQGCLEKGFTRRERQDAYKLILLCHLYNDNQASADSAMPKFLKKFPDYEINATDPKEFVYLFNSYNNLPVLSIGVVIGMNLSQVNVTETYSMSSTNGVPRKYKSGGVGSQYGIQINTFLATNWELGVGAIIATNKFSSTDAITFGDITTQTIQAAETENRYEFPVFVRYDFKPLKKFTPYARIGLVPGYTSSVSATLSRSFVGRSIQNDAPAVSKDLSSLRKQLGFWGLAAVGIKWDAPPLGFAWLDIKFQPGLNQLNIVKQNDPVFADLKNTYNYRSDNFSLNTMAVSAGFSFSFYRPTKKHVKQADQ